MGLLEQQYAPATGPMQTKNILLTSAYIFWYTGKSANFFSYLCELKVAGAHEVVRVFFQANGLQSTDIFIMNYERQCRLKEGL